MDEMVEAAKKKDVEEASSSKGKEQVAKEDIMTEGPFLKDIKELGGKDLEGIPLFSGKMDPKLVMEWIEGMKDHFECEGITKAQKVKVAKSRLRGAALTWCKYLHREREKLYKRPIANWKAMVSKVKGQYLLKDYEIHFHKKRKSLKQKDLDVAINIEEFQKIFLRSRVKEDEEIKVARYLRGLE